MGRRSLNELESARLLSAARGQYGEVCRADGELGRRAAADGGSGWAFRWWMKVLSDDILHKTDLGCVYLNIQSVEEMRGAYGAILENARKTPLLPVFRESLCSRCCLRALRCCWG